MIKPHILIVEDEDSLLASYRKLFDQHGYRTLGVRAGEDVLRAFRTFAPDVILLDLTLAGQMTGLEVLKSLRRESTDVRVIILTSDATEISTIRGLRLTADDYVVKKAVTDKILLLKVETQLRRMPVGNTKIYRYGDVVIDLDQGRIRRGGKEFPLERTRFKVLARLLQTPGQCVGYRELLQTGWGSTLGQDTTKYDRKRLHACIYKIRKAIGAHLIENEAEIGFFILVPDHVETSSMDTADQE